jgi:diadenosine tetraphosphate (Ap4A) HIT family hydrolase
MSKEHVNLKNARLEDQRRIMEQIAEDEVCPFCPENLERYHNQPILRRGQHWTITPNQWPYKNTKTHFLAIATHHVVRLQDLKEGAGEELFGHFRWAEEEYKIAAGGLAMRFGDVGRNGATVAHLHAHLIAPSPDNKPDTHVRFKLS